MSKYYSLKFYKSLEITFKLEEYLIFGEFNINNIFVRLKNTML